jgi:hypothetical protein
LTLKSVANGAYLGIEEPPADGVHLVVVTKPFTWTIQFYDSEIDVENSATSDPTLIGCRLFVPNTIFNMNLTDREHLENLNPIQLRSKQVPGLNQVWLVEEGESPKHS